MPNDQEFLSLVRSNLEHRTHTPEIVGLEELLLPGRIEVVRNHLKYLESVSTFLEENSPSFQLRKFFESNFLQAYRIRFAVLGLIYGDITEFDDLFYTWFCKKILNP